MGVPLSAVERAMQIRDVLVRAMNKEYSWLRAAEILGITPRGLRRVRQRMEQFGYQGLVDRRHRRRAQASPYHAHASIGLARWTATAQSIGAAVGIRVESSLVDKPKQRNEVVIDAEESAPFVPAALRRGVDVRPAGLRQ